jgi:hypothetical protein
MSCRLLSSLRVPNNKLSCSRNSNAKAVGKACALDGFHIVDESEYLEIGASGVCVEKRFACDPVLGRALDLVSSELTSTQRRYSSIDSSDGARPAFPDTSILTHFLGRGG